MSFRFEMQGYSEASAELSDDELYRYSLTRAWAPGGKRAVVVGYNPSTADASKDDQTIRRLRQLLRDAGYSGFTIVNLFAFRATDPRVLAGVPDPEGPENSRAVADALASAGAVIVAWGSIETLADIANRAEILTMADNLKLPVLCFGRTKGGAPRHPSRLPRSARLEPWLASEGTAGT